MASNSNGKRDDPYGAYNFLITRSLTPAASLLQVKRERRSLVSASAAG